MRILIDARKAFDSGIGTYIRCVLPRVVALLHDVQFSALVEAGGAKRHNYVSPGTVRFVEMSSPPLGLWEQGELRSVIRQTDLFWATSLAHPLFARTPMIVTVHDVAQLAAHRHHASDLLVKAAASLYFRSLRSSTELMFFNSTFTRSEFYRYVGEPRATAIVTPLGVDPAWFVNSAAPSTARRPYVICVSNLRPHKNLLLLLQSFADLKNQLPYDLVLVGKPEGFQTRNAATASALHELGDRVRFTGFLSDAELRMRVAAAQALVVPSLYEGFGLPALEAMAAGVPVIAAQSAALPEVCGDCASYFDPMSHESLKQQLLKQAALQPEERNAQVAHGLARARTFTWDKTAKLTADALDALRRGTQQPMEKAPSAS